MSIELNHTIVPAHDPRASAQFLASILGLPGLDFDDRRIILRPRYDLLHEANGGVFTRAGWFRISWSRSGDTLMLVGIVPDGLEAQVHSPLGKRITFARGQWISRVDLRE